jgi:two-component system sensor histidine kinase TctE
MPPERPAEDPAAAALAAALPAPRAAPLSSPLSSPLSAPLPAPLSAPHPAPPPGAAGHHRLRSIRRWLAPALARRGESRSLFGEILDWMFAPLLLLWPVSVSITYLVAQSIASNPYDRALVERGEALAAHVGFESGRARFDLSPGLYEIYGNGVGESGPYAVFDADGRCLAGDRDLPRPRPPAGALARDPAGGETFQLRDDLLRGRPVRIAAAWLAPAGSAVPLALVEAAESPAERTQLANEIIKGVILPQFVVLPLALILVWFGLSRGLAPLSLLQRTIRDRRPEDLSPIETRAAPEEIAPLLASFNELLARMAHNLEVQKRFIADAAHQMKTPLAGLRTQAELAQRGADPDDLQRSLRQIAAATERATRMVNQLLALARAEHGAGESAARVSVDLDRLARDVVQGWVAQALAQGVDLGYEGPAQACRLAGSPTLLRELLNNLIDNALRYGSAAAGAASAHPAVTVRVRGDGAALFLEVEDSGPGVAAADRAHVFERFYRVLGTGHDGSGLGLAIVREIAQQHGGSVELRDARPGAGAPGALFRVSFPAARAG